MIDLRIAGEIMNSFYTIIHSDLEEAKNMAKKMYSYKHRENNFKNIIIK